ncbi:enoyl-CoA hydratase-related protein [Sandaracinobacter sp. RS1-74]|uniref:enoyl-CoA hydratase/isomerase family protein n=1 Tax=Sandaracinobacteroides sayramensis TaxID=2913411 RepID=UPI001EDC8A1C|nr:enoyl-CoA hydratase-related protein [Sandaracinobacteroides sayramensis]MCG2840926.1 enoyl-CoA hydratase-related protein [Sandaracinobacteroides sayramensis]
MNDRADERVKLSREGGIATILLDRADRMNAIDDAMTLRLIAIFSALAEDRETRAVVIQGEGRNFSTGGDIGNIAEWLSPDPQSRHDRFTAAVTNLSKPLALALENVPQPLIVAVRGHAIGVALQIVIMADLVVASESARFTLPQLDLAHTPDHGESWALPRKIGLSRSLQMALMAERIDAVTAERFGLVNWVVPDPELEARTTAVATRIAGSPVVATRGVKALLHGATGLSLAQALDREIAMLGQVVKEADFVEAITAFTEKRPPSFGGR